MQAVLALRQELRMEGGEKRRQGIRGEGRRKENIGGGKKMERHNKESDEKRKQMK